MGGTLINGWRHGAGCLALGAMLLCDVSAAMAASPTITSAIVDAQPSSRPVKAATSFSTALQCMDRLLAQYDKHNIRVMADEFSDPTGTLKLGGRDMLIDALASMSITSNAFVFVDLDNSPNVEKAGALARSASKITLPDFYIKSSFVRSDQGIAQWGSRTGIAIKEASGGNARDNMVSVIGLDMTIGDAQTRELKNDTRTSNEIAIKRSGKSTQFELLLPFASFGYDKHLDTSEGAHEAARTLIDLSAIEMIGRFTRVPYWKCLELPETDPKVIREAQIFFAKMKPLEKISVIQAGLARAGEYAGRTDGYAAPDFGEAVSRYRAKHNLPAGTTADFELYFSLLNEGLTAVPQPGGAGGAQPKGAPAPAPMHFDPLGQGLQLALEPSAPSFVRGDSFRITVTTNRDAYVYCFASQSQAEGMSTPRGARIFPNRFSPNAFVKGGVPLTIPEDEKDLRMRVPDAGTEKIICLARTEPFASPLPAAIADPDLAEQQRSLSTIIYQLQAYDRKALNSTVKFVTLTVSDAPVAQ